MPRHPGVYAEMLGERLARADIPVWLINTGWTGGPYGVGERMNIGYTRSMVHAALSGALDGVETVVDPVFGLDVPTSCPDVPSSVLKPRSTWNDPEAYDRQARELARMFARNFESYASGVSAAVAAAGPRAD
jgi:phosphoenolpyruvate carboxykinase (ATP)